MSTVSADSTLAELYAWLDNNHTEDGAHLMRSNVRKWIAAKERAALRADGYTITPSLTATAESAPTLAGCSADSAVAVPSCPWKPCGHSLCAEHGSPECIESMHEAANMAHDDARDAVLGGIAS